MASPFYLQVDEIPMSYPDSFTEQDVLEMARSYQAEGYWVQMFRVDRSRGVTTEITINCGDDND